MELSRLSDVLWAQRHLLELLLFKLEQEQLVLTSGRTRWLAQASREVANVIDAVRDTEVGRAAEAEAAARSLDLPDGSSLGQVADAAPAPWDELLRAHRAALAGLAAEIREVTENNRELLATSYQATRETLATLESEAATYSPDGRTSSGDRSGQIIDRSL